MGQSVLLDCAAAGAPRPNHTWIVPPNSQSAQGSPLTSSSLNVQLSDESDAGEYICTVQNGVGTISRIFIVKIASKCFTYINYVNTSTTSNIPFYLIVDTCSCKWMIIMTDRVTCSICTQPHPDHP